MATLLDIHHTDRRIFMNKLNESRSLYDIALDIRRDWKNVYFGAKPYLDAMSTLDSIHDRYIMDSGKSIVAYFLANARGWKGEKAKEIKKELNKMLKESVDNPLDYNVPTLKEMFDLTEGNIQIGSRVIIKPNGTTGTVKKIQGGKYWVRDDADDEQYWTKGDLKLDEVTNAIDLPKMGGMTFSGENVKQAFKALLKQMGIDAKQLGKMSVDKKKAFFKKLDSMVRAKKEGLEESLPYSRFKNSSKGILRKKTVKHPQFGNMELRLELMQGDEAEFYVIIQKDSDGEHATEQHWTKPEAVKAFDGYVKKFRGGGFTEGVINEINVSAEVKLMRDVEDAMRRLDSAIMAIHKHKSEFPFMKNDGNLLHKQYDKLNYIVSRMNHTLKQIGMTKDTDKVYGKKYYKLIGNAIPK